MVIAHRLSTIKDADWIIVLHEGQSYVLFCSKALEWRFFLSDVWLFFSEKCGGSYFSAWCFVIISLQKTPEKKNQSGKTKEGGFDFWFLQSRCVLHVSFKHTIAALLRTSCWGGHSWAVAANQGTRASGAVASWGEVLFERVKSSHKLQAAGCFTRSLWSDPLGFLYSFRWCLKALAFWKTRPPRNSIEENCSPEAENTSFRRFDESNYEKVSGLSLMVFDLLMH